MKDGRPSEQDPENRRPCGGEHITHSADETFELARRIGERLTGGEIFLLVGDLGAGKTVFAKGIAAGLGIAPEDVTSPSFTLVNAHRGRLQFYHVDLYRLETGPQHHLGLEELFEDQNAVTLIEWAERLSFHPAGAVEVEISGISESQRSIRIG